MLMPLQCRMARRLLFAFSLVSLFSDIFTNFTIFTRFGNFTLNANNLKPALETVVYFLGSGSVHFPWFLQPPFANKHITRSFNITVGSLVSLDPLG